MDTITIGNQVFIAVAPSPFSGCGHAYILRCDVTLACKIHQQIRTRAIFIQFFMQLGDLYVFVGHYGDNSSGCSSYPEIFKYNTSTGLFASLYNVTSAVYRTQQSLSSSNIVVQNLASLLPPGVLGSPLQASPLDALGTQSITAPTLSRVFVANNITYLIRAHAWTDFHGIDVFIIDRKSLVARKLQRIATRAVVGLDIGYIDGRIVLAVADSRSGKEMVKLYSFIEERQSFYYYKCIHITGKLICYLLI